MHEYIVSDFVVPGFEHEWQDLKTRLINRKRPSAFDSMEWKYGTNPVWAEQLLDDWVDFDWLTARKRLNAYPHKVVSIYGQQLHFVHFQSDNSGIPILLLHGWPSSFVELLTIAQHLNNAGMEVIVPSLPGFVFSDDVNKPGLHSSFAADVMHQLMTGVLGHDTYFAHGGDFGANIANRLAVFYPQSVRAIHVMATLPPAFAEPLCAEGKEYKALCDNWYETHGGYMHIQRTQSQTLAYGLSDSPAGLGVWLAEKFWSWCEFEQNLEEVIARDELLTLMSLYWFTNCINSTNRWYADAFTLDRRLVPGTKVLIPTRLFLTLEPVDKCPKIIADDIYSNLDYGLAGAGGHFLAWEQPALLSADLLRFIKKYA